MNQKMYEMKTLLNVAGASAALAGSVVDLTPSASINRREMKLVIGAQVLTAGTFPLTLTECDTTNGTFTTVSGDTIANVVATQAAQSVTEYHVLPSKRYVKAAIGTVAGTGAAANLIVMLMNLKRSSM
jgi:hypothetical protein